MAAFGADGRCLMRALQEELDDPEPADCGRCAVCAGPRYDGPLDPALVREAAGLLRSRPLVLEVKKMAPGEDGAMRKLPEDVRAEEGRALARLGDGGWDPLVREGLARRPHARRARGGRGRGAARLAGAGGVGRRRPVRRAGDPVTDVARRLAAAPGCPFLPLVERAQDRPPQREMANSAQQVANVRGAFRIAGDPPPSPGLLVDDVRFSGWTLAMVAGPAAAPGRRSRLSARADLGLLSRPARPQLATAGSGRLRSRSARRSCP